MTLKTVLVIEDDPSDEKLTVHALKRCGVSSEILVQRDGVAALDYLFKTGPFTGTTAPPPALVLLDLKLPRIDGLEVLRRLRADSRTKLVPVVVLTSSREDEDVARSYASGANAYVRKPVDFADFLNATRTLGLFWLRVNETAT